MKYFLGLDNGGTITKAALYTSCGEEVGIASIETRMITPRPGYTERDMEEMWEANCTVIRSVIQTTAVDPCDIAGLAVCGHGKGLYLWGKDNRPARHGIISTDNRAWEYPLRWNKNGIEEKVFSRTFQHILACQPVSLLAWLKDNEPDTIDNIQWIFECKDYVRFRLTGEARAEITDYSGANLINLKTRQYDDALLKLFGLEGLKSALPPLCTASEICGYVTEEAAALTGLVSGTPVAGGMFDIDACAVAVNVVDGDYICMIAGTWSINEYLSREPVTDGKVLMNSLFCIPEYYLIEECSPTSAGNNEWFIKTLMPEFVQQKKEAGESIYADLSQMVANINPAEFCPVFLPFLLASNVHPNAKAAFVGMSNYHTRAHILRSIYEGIAFSHKYHVNKLLSTRVDPPKGIRLAGGVTHSKVWTQMFADIMQLPIECVDVGESGALGCAIAAAVAVGEHKNIKEAAKHMCKLSPAILPNKNLAEIYEKKYEIYLKVIQALDGVWNDIQKVM